MKLAVHVAKGCSPTGETLMSLLVKEGLQVGMNGAEAHVCWGAGGSHGKPTLNAACGRYNKLEELIALDKAGVKTVPYGTSIPRLGDAKFPLLARKLKHHGGRDILVCRSPLRCRKALARGRAFFTQLVPSTTEYRVWVYRNRHLGTYEKVLKYPEQQHKAIGRNYSNGYAFELCKEASIPRDAVGLAIKAIEALGLDFGAVDILLGRDGKYYVLEVNTAPGVEGEGRQVIQGLAHRIARWAAKGFPKRGARAEQG